MASVPFVPNARVARFDLVQTLDNQRVLNSMYFAAVLEEHVWDAATLENAAAALADSWTTAVMANQVTVLRLVEVVGTSMESKEAPRISFAVTPPAVGAQATEAMSNNVAFCVTLRTAHRGRGSQGRLYLAGLSVAQVTGNYVDTVPAAAIVAGVKTVIDAMALSGYTACVYSRRENNEWLATGGVAYVQAVLATDLTVDSQRRRLPGRGR
jgi:hypothetical protein